MRLLDLIQQFDMSLTGSGVHGSLMLHRVPTDEMPPHAKEEVNLRPGVLPTVSLQATIEASNLHVHLWGPDRPATVEDLMKLTQKGDGGPATP